MLLGLYWRTLGYEQTNTRKWADVISRSCARMIIILPAGCIRNEMSCNVWKRCQMHRWTTAAQTSLCTSSGWSEPSLSEHTYVDRRKMKIIAITKESQPGYSHAVGRHLKPPYSLILLNSFTTKKQTTKFSSANFKKMRSPNYIILRVQRLVGKQCRSRWGGSRWGTSSRSTLFANSAVFVSGT